MKVSLQKVNINGKKPTGFESPAHDKGSSMTRN